MFFTPKFMSLAKFVLAGVLLAPICVARAAVTPRDSFTPKWPYTDSKVRGVNLGGWLVTEPWITPSFYASAGGGDTRIVDEWTYGLYSDPITGPLELQAHWDTFITVDDFESIAAAGLNHVRIPIGYWAFNVEEDEPYIQGQIPYLLQAVEWANTFDLNVIVDLHGAPGSQNGFDNSGQRLPAPLWHTDEKYVSRTDMVLQNMTALFAGNPTVTMIEPLNEPLGPYNDDVLHKVQEYYVKSGTNIRGSDDNTVVLVHDAFEGPAYWNSADDIFLFPNDPANRQNPSIVFDTHIYQIFSDDLIQLNEQQHIDQACSSVDMLSQYPAGGAIVGEFSPANTDCALWLNGRGNGARYDGSLDGDSTPAVGDCSTQTGCAEGFTPDYKEFLGKFWEAQTEAYEQGGLGWIQWTWKTEEDAGEEWSYSKGLELGWIPQNASDPTDRMYPGICGSTPPPPI